MKHFLTFIYIISNIVFGILCFKIQRNITLGELLFVLMLSSIAFFNYAPDEYFDISLKISRIILSISPTIAYIVIILINSDVCSKVLF